MKQSFFTNVSDDTKVLQRLEQIRVLNMKNKKFVNKDLYRLFFKQELYIIAFNKLKNNVGALTPATEFETLDGFSYTRVSKIIGSLRDESFQPKLYRLKQIPKPNGTKRPIVIQGPTEKLIQEIIRMILNAVFDDSFDSNSHGFRIGKGCHTALNYVRTNFDGVSYIIKSDIKNCFGRINHKILIRILRERISDERFIRLINKFLKAGYLCETTNKKVFPKVGTPQGSIISPILCNIYLDKLDKFINLRISQNQILKNKKHNNPKVASLKTKITRIKKQLNKIENAIQKPAALLQRHKLLKELKITQLKLLKIPLTIRNKIHIYYVRYADDWIIGINGPKTLAKRLESEMHEFLANELQFTLSEEKTQINEIRKTPTLFLGYELRLQKRSKILKLMHPISKIHFLKGTTGHKIKLHLPKQLVLKRLYKKGFCTEKGFPVSYKKLTSFDDYTILLQFNSVRSGLINYYCLCDNSHAFHQIDYILRYSLAKTLAHKHKTTCHQIFKKYGRTLTVQKVNVQGKIVKTSMPTFKSFKPKSKEMTTRDLFQVYSCRLTNFVLNDPCVICGSYKNIQSHHIKHVKKSKNFNFDSLLKRKQIPVCVKCHNNIHKGRYNGKKLTRLKFNSGKYIKTTN
uniref:hypothetical protein n=1 Tax=Symbiochloris sp. SG-2018 TaxID=2126034 RepID=UPI002115A6E3|nr:hypothetical protein NRL16_pgp029 [Symbiochloris sp. SG-2018]UTQ75741.1 hypothetical protein [Symbiochloris sp. SG-2018]